MLKAKSTSHLIVLAAGLLGQIVASNAFADGASNGTTGNFFGGQVNLAPGQTMAPAPAPAAVVTGSQEVTNVGNGQQPINYNDPALEEMRQKYFSNNGSQQGAQQNNKNQKVGNGRCDASKALTNGGLTMDCDTTYKWIENAQLADVAAQAAGGVAVGTAGQVGAIKAQSAGTQSAVMQAAANTNENAGMLKTTTGMANLAMGIYQVKLANKHSDNSQQLNDKLAKTNGQSNTGNVTDNADLLKQGAGEQDTVHSAAMSAGVKSIINGVRDTVAGVLAIGAANQAKDLANKLQDSTGSNYQITSANPDTLTNTTGSTTAINPGTQTDPAVATNDQNIKAGDVPNISPPVNPDPTSGGPGAGPVAGSFQAGNPAAGNGGGGSPSLGVGGLSPAKGDPEPGGPRMAESKANTAYGQGGSGYAPGGGGVSAEKSADLGFLANLLPKPQEEMGKNGILDYGNAGRSPASVAPYSFLGKDVNIFQRISDRTTAKLRSGDIGI